MRSVGRAAVVLSVMLGAVGAASAQEGTSPSTTPTPDFGKWGFNGGLGTGGIGGDFGNILTKPVSAEFNFFQRRGAWRFGAGVNYASFLMKEPYQDEPEWGSLQIYGFGTRMFRMNSSVRPYIQLRAGTARLHPRSELFATLPPDPEDSGKSLQPAANGFFIGVIPGLELRLSRAAFLDASFSWKYFSVDEYDLSPVKHPPYSTGSPWEARFGVTWIPNGNQPPDQPGVRDAWGVQRSYGWAAGEVLAINNVASIATEYIRKVNFAQISPRSFWHNIEEGFTYDDNEFKTNQWAHPFNGAAYYNSGRANGVGFWPSAGFAMAGAFYWECCGETHPMSFNDMISTGIGGIALGEAQYRLSSEILNAQSAGLGRFLREFGSFIVDPVRGFNRVVSGRAWHQADNPENPMDWRPPGGTTFLAIGTRTIGQGSSISENTKTYGTVLLNHSYGNVFENDRRKPFDFMDFVASLSFGEKNALDNVQIRGNVASWPLGSAATPKNVFAIVQYFDYMNNNAYEFGGQSLGASLSSRFELSDKASITTRVDGLAVILGAVNADYSWLADVAEQERIREYDYGPGLGALASANLSISGRAILSALYRFNWISVSNGSVYDKGTVGSDANHYVQGGGLRLMIPLKGGLGIGSDAFLFYRDSHYELNDTQRHLNRTKNVSQRNPQVRVYLAFNNVRAAR